MNKDFIKELKELCKRHDVTITFDRDMDLIVIKSGYDEEDIDSIADKRGGAISERKI